MSKVTISQLAGMIQGEIRYSVPMSEYTSFRVGGRVDYMAFPADREDMQKIIRWCNREGVLYFVLGNGTNLLVRDGGIRGVAISLARGFLRCERVERGPQESLILAEAGGSLKKLVEFSWQEGLSGLEFAAGIPGTVGGAFFMNAGAFQGEMKDVVDSFQLMAADGSVQEKGKGTIYFSYRSQDLPPGGVILAGRLRLKEGSGPAIKAKVEEILRQRMAKQPYDLPSAGSVFKNPTRGPAGRLIEEVGLKGSRVGDAQVSEKHANFIVNRGNAKARDILSLIEKVREKVFQEKGVALEMEIQVVGED